MFSNSSQHVSIQYSWYFFRRIGPLVTLNSVRPSVRLSCCLSSVNLSPSPSLSLSLLSLPLSTLSLYSLPLSPSLPLSLPPSLPFSLPLSLSLSSSLSLSLYLSTSLNLHRSTSLSLPFPHHSSFDFDVPFLPLTSKTIV